MENLWWNWFIEPIVNISENFGKNLEKKFAVASKYNKFDKFPNRRMLSENVLE